MTRSRLAQFLAFLLLAVLICLPHRAVAARPKRGSVPPVTVVQRPWPPVVTVRVVISAGSLHDPVGQEGMAQLCWTGILRGAGDKDRAQFAQTLESLGAHLDAHVDKLGATIVGEVLVEELEPFLALLADAVLRPRLDPAELDLARHQLLSDLTQLRDEDESLAHDAIGRYLYRGQPLGRPTSGTELSLLAIPLGSIKAWHARQVVAGNVRLGFAGAIDEARAKALTEKWFGELPKRAPEPTPVPARPPLNGRRLLLLDKPRRTQAQVIVAWPTVGARHKDAIALQVGNAVLGGTFTSRLNHEIRELRGWSYGTWSAIAAGPQVSTLALGFAPANGDATPALDLAVRIVEEMQQSGVTAHELRFAKDFLKGQHRFALETADRELALRMRAAQLGMQPSDIDTWPARIEAVDLRTVNRVLKEQLHPEHLVAVVVGAGKSLKDKLDAAGSQFAVEVLPKAGAPETTTAAGHLVGKKPPPVIDQPPPPDEDPALHDPPDEGETDEAPDKDAP
jgi:zinc protease